MIFAKGLKPLNQIPTNNRIATAIRKAIFTGEYKAGQKLTLNELETSFGGFRTPIREALVILESQGLIEHAHNRISRVAKIDTKFIKDTYDIREILEDEAIRKCCTLSDFQSDQLLKLQDSAEKEVESMSLDEYVNYDLFFHSEIWRQSRNRKLISFITQVWNGPYVGSDEKEVTLWKTAMKEHRDILEGIIAHDTQKAQLALNAQIERSRERTIQAIQKTLTGGTA
ncbi:MAG: GntR family transcriptional regulator [Spirochaetaceae bacterium]|nr:GntR family transcriptional regulator [Spirochaetaceae bacterium]